MGYVLILGATIGMFATAGLCIGFAQSRTNSFFIVGGATFAIGAYASAIGLTNGITEIAVLFLVSCLCSSVVGMTIPLLTGLHDDRVLDIVGLAFLLLCGVVVRSWYDPSSEAGSFASLTNGSFGLGGFPPTSLAGLVAGDARVAGLLFSALVLGLYIVLIGRTEQSMFGISLHAMRDDRLQAALDGHRVLVRQIGLGALVGSGLGACGLGYVLIYRYVDPSLFNIENAIGLCLIPLVCPFGGLRTRALVGSVIFVLLPEAMRGIEIASPYETYIRNLIFLGVALASSVSVRNRRPRPKSTRRQADIEAPANA